MKIINPSMKTFSLSATFLCLFSLSLFAQEGTLSPSAKKLFINVDSNLTISEKNLIAELSGFEYNSNDQRLYKTTGKTNDKPFSISSYALDITKDGIEEIGIIYTQKDSSGKKSIGSMLFIKDKNGSYKLNIDQPGELYFLNLNGLAYADIFIKNSTVGLPTYRWNGSQYSKYKFLEPGDLKKYTINTIITTSKTYNSIKVGE